MQENTGKKKILYVITKGNFGGAQRYVYDLATSLPKDKFEAVVACGPNSAKAPLGKGGLIEVLQEKEIKTIEINGLGREIDTNKDFRVLRNLIKIIREEKPDIIHLNSSKIGLLGSLAILYLRIKSFIFSSLSRQQAGFHFFIPKSVFTAHGWAFNEKQRSFLFRIATYIGQYLTVLICDITVAVSEKAKKDIAFLPFIKNKIKVVYNGIKKFDLLPKEEARIILASKDADKIIIFSISELNKNKGIDIALRALSILPKEARSKIVYSIAGDGEEKEELEKLSLNLGIRDMVRFLGFVPNAKKLLSGTDIFLLPSRTEALPYAILEAGLAELPIVATCAGGIPEIIKDMQNGILVHRQNLKETAEAILYFLDHEEKRKEFGKEIKKTITNFFSLEKMLQETIGLYR